MKLLQIGLKFFFRDSDQQHVKEVIESKKLEIQEAIKNASMDKIIIKANPKKKHKGPRSSKFRGVSLNGKKWQTLVMGPNKNAYRGRHAKEVDAAKDYDRHSILRQGLCVRNNKNFLLELQFSSIAYFDLLEKLIILTFIYRRRLTLITQQAS